jgi:hypothetical protein
MALRKDEREDQKTTSTAFSLTSEKQQQEIREAIVNAFDEAKDNTQRAVKEAKKEIPRYKEAINNYQEKALEVAKEMAENHIDSQKEIIKLLQHSSWMPLLGEHAYRTFWPNWISSKGMIETYANMVSNYVDNNFAALRLCNDMMFVNGESLKNSMNQVRDNVKVFSKIALGNAKTFERVFGEYAKAPKDST